MVNGLKCGQGEEDNLNTKTRYQLERKENEVDRLALQREVQWLTKTLYFFCRFTSTRSLSFTFSHYPNITNYSNLFEKGTNTFFTVE